MNFLAPYKDLKVVNFQCSWKSPSNIAFVKYWGKKGHQLPANPSLSMTLKECFTKTSVEFSPGDHLAVELFLEGERKDKFAHKIKTYLESLQSDLPWIKNLQLKIQTQNTFPHGTGIASSASGLSALALCLTDYLHQQTGEERNAHFFKRASLLSRLASGSACRSVYGGFASWGEESELFASPVEVHASMQTLNDAILVVSAEEKLVSSTAGHARLTDHPFAESRFNQARGNYKLLKVALLTGDMDALGMILENEALSLHAMMMTSPESFTLLKPLTLTAIEKIRAFRKETHLPLYFTLDAGPNLHLIYPHEGKTKIENFILDELRPLSVQLIHDQRGEGPEKC